MRLTAIACHGCRIAHHVARPHRPMQQLTAKGKVKQDLPRPARCQEQQQQQATTRARITLNSGRRLVGIDPRFFVDMDTQSFLYLWRYGRDGRLPNDTVLRR